METVEDNTLINTTIDIVNKPNEKIEATIITEQPNVSQESNGNLNCSSTDNTDQVEEVNSEKIGVENNCEQVDHSNSISNSETDQIASEIVTETKVNEDVNNVQTSDQLEEVLPDLNEEMVVTVVVDESDVTLHNDVVESSVEISNTEITLNDEVKFQTEVLVEQQENDETKDTDNHEIDSTDILNDFSNNIELSEALRSSDVNEVIIENNSSNTKEEVFNKEELLDILEGNDVEPIASEEQITNNKIIEAQIALKQLNRLQNKKVKTSPYQKVKKTERKTNEKKESDLSDEKVEADKIQARKRRSSSNQRLKKDRKTNDRKGESGKETGSSNEKNVEADKNDDKVEADSLPKKAKVDESKKKPEENIVNVLVQDWDDDEGVPEDSSAEPNQPDQVMDESKNTSKDSEEIKEAQKQIINPEELMNQSSQDSTASEDQTQSIEKGHDGEPPRRISRVIKKKVIFDPDNPDTFTKSKTPSKNKEIKDTSESLIKKIKVEPSVPRSKSKSPSSKLQWKKPSIKNSKQCKRLTEVDRLLMDEGAVNMIYQLTPEALKGKKNMRTKAEFIKKIQSSTPDGNEMKFRERKKESMKHEDGEPRKILGGKHRSSLSSSVKSPAVSEDFETHSADDSIIYRRHSSSSYSSSCMSPRRLSDVDGISMSNSHNAAQPTSENQNTLKSGSNLRRHEAEATNVFMSDNQLNSPGEIINKNDCLSIKEKLNSKLNLALNKRKRETIKTDKPPLKYKKLSKDENSQSNFQFNIISINIENRLAVITVEKADVKFRVEILKEIVEALNFIDAREDISVTLLTSQCAALCSNLEYRILLEENKEAKTAKAYELAESLRSLWCAAARHSKLVWCAVSGACAGAGVSLAALADAALAADGTSFVLGPALPAAAALAHRLPPPLVNELVVFGRRISASEAIKGGLISRTVWPDRFDEQVYNMAKDIAAQPLETILLKKKLLNLKRSGEVASFLSCLEAERDLLVEYWTSVEGQEILRANLDAA